MQRILRKRVLRDLKKNVLRYLALGMLIVLGMYLIVSMVDAAETVIVTVDRLGEEHRIEDGQFQVFVPLTDKQKKSVTDKGVELEENFYLDYVLEDATTIRTYQNRDQIDLIAVEEGRLAEASDELLLEKRYAEMNEYHVNDQISIGGLLYTITGIGTVPDYDSVLKDLTDSSSDSKNFGLAFISEDGYQTLKDTGKSAQSEAYVYSYRLNGGMSDEELQNDLKDMAFSNEDVTDSYFQEYWEQTAGKKEELLDALQELEDGSTELEDGIGELTQHNENLKEGATSILESYLSQAQTSLKSVGLNTTLTKDNYEAVLTELKNTTDQPLVKLELNSLLSQLNQLNSYADGITEYTDGVASAGTGAGELNAGIEELNTSMSDLMDQYFSVDTSNLTQLVKAQDNPRIKASSGDQIINKYAGMVAGVIIMILFTYVISVFVIHGIEQESSIIGALYALGVNKKDLIRHYLTLPFLVTAIAGVIGTGIGFSRWGMDTQMKDVYDYFSVPKLQTVYPVYLILYGIVMPSLISAIVNYLVIHKKLSQPALVLIRNEQKIKHTSRINLGKMGFLNKFRMRQMIREMRTSFTVLFGMFISLLIVMLSLDCYAMCNHMKVDYQEDTQYEYMYTYKYPEENVPAGGEAAYAKALEKDYLGYRQNITVLGIDDDNPYFDADVTSCKNEIVISSAMAQKLNLKTGDQIVLTDEEEKMDYAFTVKGITDYSVSLYCFMNIDSMRELFGASEDYYNVVLSDHELAIDMGRLYAVTSKDDIVKSSQVFIDQMWEMIIMLVGVSTLIFCVVMYLMMKVMVDRAHFSISLIKIFGFRKKEIRKLYLDGNFYLVAIGAAVLIPLSKKAMNLCFPLLVSNVSCGMNLNLSWQIYLGLYAGILILYLLINQFLIRQLDRMSPAEVLKNRE